MIQMEKRKSIRNLVIFIALVLVSGWIGVVVDRFLPEQPQGNSLGMGIWLVLPLLVSLILRAFAGDGWKDIGFLPNLKGNLKWYIISFFIYPAVTFITILIGTSAGWIDPSALDGKLVSNLFVSGLIIQFIKNFFEESVWRGYLTSKLLKLEVNDFRLYLITGCVWGLWHLPYYLIFLPEGEIQSILAIGRLPFALLGVVTMTIWTVQYTEIYRLTHSIWPLVMMHMVEDSLINPLVIGGYLNIMAGKEILISPIVGIITTLFYLLIGLILRRFRMSRQIKAA